MSRYYRVQLKSKTVDVELHERQGSHLTFSFNGERYEVEVAAKLAKPSGPSSFSPQGSYGPSPVPSSGPTSTPLSSGTVVAPMPGIIVSVAVSPGDSVEQGTTVCVMEAMKMENNIAAPCSGTVQEVMISAGDEVGNGQSLLRIE